MMNRFALFMLFLESLTGHHGTHAITISRQSQSPFPVPLRIMCAGDSITYGWTDPGLNGYRAPLYNLLNDAGAQVRMVGTVNSGDFAPSSASEGFNGAEIAVLANNLKGTRLLEPNVVLLCIGTNDVNLNDDVGNAPDRLSQLLDELFGLYHQTYIVVATIPPIGTAASEARVVTYNAAIPGVVKKYKDQGNNITLADINSVLTTADLTAGDSLHPSHEGYAKMAQKWYQTLLDISSDIPPPLGSDSANGSVLYCAEPPSWAPVGAGPLGSIIASGVGTAGDAIFHDNWSPLKDLAGGIGHGLYVDFYDIDGDGRADYVLTNEKTGAATVYLNRYGEVEGNWLPLNSGKPILPGTGTNHTVMWADIDGDGKFDYLLVTDAGAVSMWLNQGADDSSSTGWAFKEIGQIASGGIGARDTNLIWGDIDGNGRWDYIIRHEDGSLDVYFNFGDYGQIIPDWTRVTGVHSGPGTANVTTPVYIRDLNGDGRGDYLWLDEEGGITAWMNVRGNSAQRPNWVRSPGKVAGGGFAEYLQVRLADITGDGKADYVVLNLTTGAVPLWYENNGKADTSTVDDGLWTVDMDGDGLADYVFVAADGVAICYLNGGPNTEAANGWLWTPAGNGKKGVGKIADGISPHGRNEIFLADITGSGRADYLIIDQTTGAIDMYENDGANAQANNGWNWVPKGQIASGNICGKRKVWLYDLDGDGRADYLCVDEKGAIEWWQNQVFINPLNWVHMETTASGVGAYRQDVKMADLNGDLRADYLWVNPVDGSVKAWYNWLGLVPGDWVAQDDGKSIASGVGAAGRDILFGDLDGDRRCEYIQAYPGSGALKAWINGCSLAVPIGGGGGGNGGGDGGGGDGGGSGSGGGSSSGGDTSSQATVYIDPTIWKENPSSVTVNCVPPCTYVLPPVTLSTPTTISFPLLTTSLEVGWFTPSTAIRSGTTTSTTVYVSVTQTTTIFIPPLTTTLIPVWNVIIGSDTNSTTIVPTRSILPPPVTLTDDPDPEKRGTTHPLNTRTVHPPPYPYSRATGSHDSLLPTITHISGPPGPLCKSLLGCGGTKCFIFCDHPCLLDCGHSGPPDSRDSNDPNSPPASSPSPTSCSTTETFSSCDIQCTPAPAAACSTSCSRVTGCRTSGTTLASTVTPAPLAQINLEPWTPLTEPFTVEMSIAQQVIARLISMGDSLPGITPTQPTTTGGNAGSSGGGGGGGPTNTAAPPPPEPTAQMVIAFSSEQDFGAVDSINTWWFYAGRIATDFNLCKDSFTSFDGPDASVDKVPFPNGTFKLPTMLQTDGCVYTGTDSGPGQLTCPNLSSAVQCAEDDDDGGKTTECDAQAGVATFVRKVVCKWA